MNKFVLAHLLKTLGCCVNKNRIKWFTSLIKPYLIHNIENISIAWTEEKIQAVATTQPSSRYSCAINLKILGDFLIKLLHSKVFQKTWLRFCLFWNAKSVFGLHQSLKLSQTSAYVLTSKWPRINEMEISLWFVEENLVAEKEKAGDFLLGSLLHVKHILFDAYQITQSPWGSHTLPRPVCVCVYATVCWCREGRGSVTGTLTNRQTGVPAGRVVSRLWNLIFAHFPGIAQPVKHRRVPPISQSTKKEDGTLNWSKQQKHICCLKLSVSH